jgi:hypothetical protein
LAPTLGVLPWWMLAAVAVTAAMCCAVVVSAQLANARGAFAFMRPSAAIAGAAPLMALTAAAIGPPSLLVWGFVVANAALLWVNGHHAGRALAATPQQ